MTSLRALHDRLARSDETSREFVARKIQTLPAMVRRVADAESAIAKIQQALENA